MLPLGCFKIYSLILKGTWKCAGVESGTPFTEVEFEDPVSGWVDYDEKVCTSQEIMIDLP